MFEQILDNYRKATEASLQIQQTMLRSWGQQWPPTSGCRSRPTGRRSPEQFYKAQKEMAETISDMLNKHRETLDAQYRAGIETIEEAFRVGEAKDPEQFRRLTEELWRHSFECLKTRGRVADARRPGRDAEVVRRRVARARVPSKV